MTSNTSRVFELGIGLFIVCMLWMFAIVVCFVTNRVKTKVAVLGPSVFVVVTLISLVLVCLPRSKHEQELDSNMNVTVVIPAEKHMNRNFDNVQLPSNWMNVWRLLILFVNIIALIVGISIIYIKWLSKRIRRPKWSVILKNSKSIDGQ